MYPPARRSCGCGCAGLRDLNATQAVPSSSRDVQAIKARFISVIVRRETIERAYPGGVPAYERDAPNATFASDDALTSVSFMDEESAEDLVAKLEALGLRCIVDGELHDIAVLSRWGSTLPCSWVEQRRSWYRLAERA